jgi:hypothetical protein
MDNPLHKEDQVAAELKPSLCVAMNERHSHLRVEWSHERKILEDALHQLPGSSDWQGVFEILLEPRGPEKTAAIVFDHEKPVAVVLLRRVSRLSWQLATNWIVPGFLFPAQPGYACAAIEALKRVVHVGCWRLSEPVHLGSRTYDVKETPTHRMDCGMDFDAYWQRSGNSSFLRQARLRCKEFTIRQNPPQGFEWVIRNWGQKWQIDSSSPFAELEDRVAVARHLEASGRHNTFILFDGDKPIAGETLLVHRECLVAQVNYRLPEYDRHGAGTYLMEEAFRWAARSGLREFDIGGGLAYKQRWAPIVGSKCTFTVAPMWKRWVRAAYARLRRIPAAFR